MVEQSEEQAKWMPAIALGFPLSCSSSYRHDHEVNRLSMEYRKTQHSGSSCWCAGSKEEGEWVQVNFIKKRKVKAIETQGRTDGDY